MSKESDFTNKTTDSQSVAPVTFGGADPFEQSAQGNFGSCADYTRVNTTQKIMSSNNSTISSMRAARTMFQIHQYVPAEMFFNNPSRRLFIADEVGLGKTIEAGHIMLELKARGELGNVLIVCPKPVRLKWRNEMNEKFGLDFSIYEKNADLFRDLELNDGRVRAIVNYERIRIRKDYDTKQEFETEAPVNLVDFLAQHSTRFSLVVCDEAHRMKHTYTQTYKGAQIIMSRAEGAILLTATPITTSEYDYYAQLCLLDPIRFGEPNVAFNLRQETAPFIAAAIMVHKETPLPEVKAWLEAQEVRIAYRDEMDITYTKTEYIPQIYTGNSIYNEIIELLDGADTPATRARLLERLNAIRQTSDIFTRTRKREITTNMTRPERKVHIVKVVRTDEEKELESLAILKYLKEKVPPSLPKPLPFLVEEGLPNKVRLGLIQVKRQLASDIYAYLSTWENLEKGIDAFAKGIDSKIERVVELIEGQAMTSGKRKVVLFATFRKTLEYLQIRLRKHGYKCIVVHGGVDDRDEVINSFRKDPTAHVLLASEVAGEGLDLEFCSTIINFDLPWNPMVVEQRIGRLDRFGQKSPVIHIYNMVVEGTILEDVYCRLWDRIGVFRWCIGEVEPILDMSLMDYNGMKLTATLEQYESQFYSGELSREEIQRKMDEIAIAIESRRQYANLLNQGLEETHSYDSYFRDQVTRLITNYSSLGGEELRTYLEDVLSTAIPGCLLEDMKDGTYCIHLPMDQPTALVDFLLFNQPAGAESEKMFADFVRDIDGRDSIVLTFEQETAFTNRALAFVNMFHPLIAACVNFNERTGRTQSEAFCYSLPYGPVKGTFYLALYEVATQRDVQGAPRTVAEFFPVLYDVQTGTVVTDRTVTEATYRLTHEGVADCKHDEALYDPALLARMRHTVEGYVAQAVIDKRQRLIQVAEAAAERQTTRTKEYFEFIIHNRQRAINLWERVLRINPFLTIKERKCLQDAIQISKAYIRYANEEREDRLARIRPGEVTVGARLLSLSLIVVDDTLDNRPDQAVFS